jgi:hypothetical protein
MAAITVEHLRPSPQGDLWLLWSKYFELDLTETLGRSRGTTASTRQGESPQAASLF